MGIISEKIDGKIIEITIQSRFAIDKNEFPISVIPISGSVYTSLNENPSLENLISVYPNPTSDLVTIEFTGVIEGAALQLCDVQGRVLLEKIVHTNKETISVGQFETGTYFLSIKGMKQAIVKQIIIE